VTDVNISQLYLSRTPAPLLGKRVKKGKFCVWVCVNFHISYRNLHLFHIVTRCVASIVELLITFRTHLSYMSTTSGTTTSRHHILRRGYMCFQLNHGLGGNIEDIVLLQVKDSSCSVSSHTSSKMDILLSTVIIVVNYFPSGD